MQVEGFKCIKEKYYQIFTLNIISKLLIFFKDFLLVLYVLNKLKLEAFTYILGINILITNILDEGIVLSLIPSIQEEELKHGKNGRFLATNKGINLSIVISIFTIILFIIFKDIMINILKFKDSLINSQFKTFFIILSLNMIFNLARAPLVAYMQSDNRFFYGAKSKALNLFTQIVLIILVNKRLNLVSLLIINLISSIVQFFYMLNPIVKEGFRFRIDFNFDKEILKRISKMFLIIVFISIINIYLNKLDLRYIKDLKLVDDYESIRLKVLSLSNLFIMAIITITYPILTMSYNLDNKEKLRNNIYISLSILIKFILILFISIILITPIVIKMNISKLGISRDEILILSTIIAISSLRMLLNLIFIFFNRVFLSIKEYESVILINITLLTLTILSSKVFVNIRFSIFKAIIYLLPFLVICLICFISLNKDYKILKIN